jgi:hypothetical protein
MANPISGIDEAGRKIAGLLTYNPGPGIYSRLERAIEQMPENVRVQELPGLLKRYKEGVPGWELKETDLDSVIAGRDAVSRSELLARVKERSPVYTHKEIVLGGTPQDTSGYVRDKLAVGSPSPLGAGGPHGDAVYGDYSQGGKDYTELLVGQPTVAGEYGSHWGRGSAKPAAKQYERNNIIAHARYDTHGDALRINELQSDLGIHNRKMREAASEPSLPPPQQLPSETDEEYVARVTEAGWRVDYRPDGDFVVSGEPGQRELPFPLEDTWADLLIKRLALEAARKGNRAIEVASPRAIADKVGGNIDNYEHFYGKVVPGALERLGRKMGGLTDKSSEMPASAGAPESRWTPGRQRLRDEIDDYEMEAGLRDLSAEGSYRSLVDAFENEGAVYPEANRLYQLLIRNEGLLAEEAAARMPELMSLAQRQSQATANFRVHHHSGIQYGAARTDPPGRRYIMSDEMRRRLIEQGVGASVLAPLLMQEER